jgi:hypothetical protein
MKVYGFTVERLNDAHLISWLNDANSRKEGIAAIREAFPGALSESQQHAWSQACVEYGGFDEQMADSLLKVY